MKSHDTFIQNHITQDPRLPTLLAFFFFFFFFFSLVAAKGGKNLATCSKSLELNACDLT
jgi:hypothetical protein